MNLLLRDRTTYAIGPRKRRSGNEPTLGDKVQAVPGTQTYQTSDRFGGYCAEYCTPGRHNKRSDHAAQDGWPAG